MSTLAVRKVTDREWPPLLREIPDPPVTLYAVGNLPPPHLKLLAVVGSRSYTTYGKQVVEHLIGSLRGYDIGIVSGLAIGVDGLAHEAALRHGLYTLSVPGSGLDESVIYPARHRSLARQIVEGGGGLLSELEPATKAARWTFPQRNRIMAGLCHATLLIEASEKSGTLITARLAVDYDRELLCVPGSIFSATSRGTHQFLKLGATLVSSAADILEALALSPQIDGPTTLPLLPPMTLHTLTLLREPLDRDTLIRLLKLPVTDAIAHLTELELEGHITCDQGIYTALTATPVPALSFDRTDES